MVPYTPGQPIQLCNLPWLAATCGDVLGLTIFEQFLYDLGEWTVETIQDGQASVLVDSPIILLRVHGVELCPLFGHELAAFDRDLGCHYDPVLLPEVDNRFKDPNTIRHICVVAWTVSGGNPKIHRVSFNDDNTVKLVRHYYLHKDLGRRETVNMWIPGGEWESGISVYCRFWVEAKYNSILIKLAEVGTAVGLGHELVALESVGKVRRGCRKVYVCLESYMGLALSVNPAYDIAIPMNMQARQTFDRVQEVEGLNEGDDVHDMDIVDTIDPQFDAGCTTISCKRPADGEGENPRPSQHMRSSSS